MNGPKIRAAAEDVLKDLHQGKGISTEHKQGNMKPYAARLLKFEGFIKMDLETLKPVLTNKGLKHIERHGYKLYP